MIIHANLTNLQILESTVYIWEYQGDIFLFPVHFHSIPYKMKNNKELVIVVRSYLQILSAHILHLGLET